MTTTLTIETPRPDCWNRIGTSGDRSCPELLVHIHCRNGPVFEAGARSFFDRPAPPGYLEEWARALDADVAPRGEKPLSLLIFRLHREWLAFPTRSVVEVTATRPVHRIPHRSNEILIGMVNLRGRLQLQGLAPRPARRGGGRAGGSRGEGQPQARRDPGGGDDLGLPGGRGPRRPRRAGPRAALGAVPSTLANPANSFSQAVIDWDGKSVGVLDAARVFAALKGVGR